MRPTNYAELRALIKRVANRKDIDDVIPDFILQAHIALVEHVGPLAELNYDEDSNYLLDYNPYVYVDGAMVHLAGFVREPELMAYYQAKWVDHLNNLSETGYDVWLGSPLQTTVV